MSKEKLLNMSMELANPKIDDILEDYYKGKHDLISVKKDVLLLCDKLMKLAYNKALNDAANSAKTFKNSNSGSWRDAKVDEQSILNTKID